MDEDRRFMRLALEAARKADAKDEVPVGAVLVLPDGRSFVEHNAPIASHDPTAHAEMRAIRAAAAAIGNYRLPGSTLYVTLEPCPMCAGAIVHTRISRVVYGASDPKTGAVESLYRLLSDTRLNHQPIVKSGLLAEESSALLKAFFRRRRSTSRRPD